MVVLEEIVEWSRDRPPWQRDALRRLVLKGDLSAVDITELATICKSAHGLAEPQNSAPLAKEHVSTQAAGSSAVALTSIFHHRGVNALAEDQTLSFGPRLTVVYGDNAAGKTGYIRILKSACRARGTEKILGNVVSGAAPQSPAVAIKYRVGGDDRDREWVGGGDDDHIARVSVFDSRCASVYLTKQTDVAFRPFGLDLFDKLVQTCKAVRAELEKEQRALATSAIGQWQVQLPEGTVPAKLVTSVSSLTKPETVRALALSPEDTARLELVEKSLLDLQANDPDKLARQLTLRAGRIRRLADHLQATETALTEQSVTSLLDLRRDGRRKRDEAQRLREATFPTGVLPGTGSESWTGLWEAAKHFSEEHAYPGQPFPVVGSDAHCVFCQQDIDEATAARLRQFATFIASTTERELRDLRTEFANRRKALNDLQVTTVAVTETLKEIRIDSEELADSLAAALDVNERRRTGILDALTSNADLSSDVPALLVTSAAANTLADQLEARVKTLQSNSNAATSRQLALEAQELRARKLLSAHASEVLAEIERKKRLAAFEVCLNDTRTHAITQKSTAVTRAVVTQTLKDNFKKELERLTFDSIEVELTEIGGAEGVLYHKLVLTRAPGVDLPSVVSEGEQRCLSIAAFFAELSTADEPSGIVFDDPVSSLDYLFREAVARRLVEEARTRQVIVFTHDPVFLHHLKQLSGELAVEQLDQHVRRLSKGAGICEPDLPWVAMAAKKKIGFLKNEWQRIDKLYREGHEAVYEKEAKHLYGLLRETWERALEEVLLGGIVERFRPSIQTKHIKVIADICEADCATLDVGMTKCSRWLPGHDQAAAARAPVPKPAELSADISALEQWIAGINRRRGSK